HRPIGPKRVRVEDSTPDDGTGREAVSLGRAHNNRFRFGLRLRDRRAGDDVSAAILMLDDGTRVTTTVQNGWAVAWWPGSHQLTSAQLTTASGTETQMFPASPCGLHNCSGGPHGGAPGGGPGGGQHQLERLCRRRPRTVAAFFKPTDWNPPLWLETPPRVEAAFAGIEREKLTITEGPHKYRR